MPHAPLPAAVVGATALLLLLSGCDTSPTAPDVPQACFRMDAAGRPHARFTLVQAGVRNLESCAALLEAVSLRERRAELTGAYQSQFIFITPDMVQSSLRLDGARYRLFDAQTRGKIDHDLNWMLEDERRGSDFAPGGRLAGPKKGSR